MPSSSSTWLLASVLFGALSGCVDIRGGAIELAWQLYRRDGIACCPDEDFCNRAGVKEVVVHMQPVDPAAGLAPVERVFACPATQATTRFDIAPGRYQFTVEGRCANQSVALGPGPIDKDVRRGEVTGLGAIALTIDSVEVCCRAAQPRICP